MDFAPGTKEPLHATDRATAMQGAYHL